MWVLFDPTFSKQVTRPWLYVCSRWWMKQRDGGKKELHPLSVSVWAPGNDETLRTRARMMTKNDLLNREIISGHYRAMIE